MQKIMQSMHPPEPRTTYHEARSVYQTLRDGDILLSREAWHFTNMFIPGYWSHAAIYQEGLDGGMVVEAVAPTVQIVSFIDWAMRKNDWVVLRPCTEEPLDGLRAASWASEQEGLPYDYQFDETNQAFYCSELVYQAYFHTNSMWTHWFTLRRTMGYLTVTPDDFYSAVGPGKLEIIHEHRD